MKFLLRTRPAARLNRTDAGRIAVRGDGIELVARHLPDYQDAGLAVAEMFPECSVIGA
jgi:hypothetical protein